jgi:hypothetical protein
MGRYPDATEWLQRSVEIRANVWYNRLYLVAAYALSGRPADAHQTLNEFNARFPHYAVDRILSYEQEIRNTNPDVVTGLAKFHDGLRAAGMPEHL